MWLIWNVLSLQARAATICMEAYNMNVPTRDQRMQTEASSRDQASMIHAARQHKSNAIDFEQRHLHRLKLRTGSQRWGKNIFRPKRTRGSRWKQVREQKKLTLSCLFQWPTGDILGKVDKRKWSYKNSYKNLPFAFDSVDLIQTFMTTPTLKA